MDSFGVDFFEVDFFGVDSPWSVAGRDSPDLDASLVVGTAGAGLGGSLFALADPSSRPCFSCGCLLDCGSGTGVGGRGPVSNPVSPA